MKDLRRIFYRHVKGQNMMTPYFIGLYKAGDYICEVTSGYNMQRSRLRYGVTVVNHVTDTREFDLSTRKDNMIQVREYMDELAKGEKVEDI